MSEVFVGIGSNVSPHAHVRLALDLLERTFGALRLSPIYRCPPVGFEGADFLNLVAAFDTVSDLDTVHIQLRDIEAACGRDRTVRRTSRTMDIDLLLFGDRIQDDETLCLPRADILEYPFVLRPLAELAPEARHPTVERTYQELWAAFEPRDLPLEAVALDADAQLSL
ncbi:2-amino-4-hydroxy-6-hydroxymethyldihydropteridine pyrophosphokinase [Salinisphaera dokdonensis CL-ES53]|uniref:2-amino-4-hydroxy-6-hydroxymethyldihydropteridine diphosphokinase n=1 Tax=Salinisphaera dokdonensis CL-ES53 TaxID=1304272 RepID=A0ABV2B355_9GAMM